MSIALIEVDYIDEHDSMNFFTKTFKIQEVPNRITKKWTLDILKNFKNEFKKIHNITVCLYNNIDEIGYQDPFKTVDFV